MVILSKLIVAIVIGIFAYLVSDSFELLVVGLLGLLWTTRGYNVDNEMDSYHTDLGNDLCELANLYISVACILKSGLIMLGVDVSLASVEDALGELLGGWLKMVPIYVFVFAACGLLLFFAKPSDNSDDQREGSEEDEEDKIETKTVREELGKKPSNRSLLWGYFMEDPIPMWVILAVLGFILLATACAVWGGFFYQMLR